MRDKIVFFILSALLATIAYFAGNANNVEADLSKLGEYDFLSVNDLKVNRILVGDDITIGDGAITILGSITVLDPVRSDSKSVVDIRVENKVPSVRIHNGTDQKTNSGILMSAFSPKDPSGSLPLLQLLGERKLVTYTLTCTGVYK